MMPFHLLFTVIKGYAKKKKCADIPFGDFVSYLEKCVLNDSDGTFDIFSTKTADAAAASLLELEQGGKIELKYSGNRIEKIAFPGFFSGLVEQAVPRQEKFPDLN